MEAHGNARAHLRFDLHRALRAAIRVDGADRGLIEAERVTLHAA